MNADLQIANELSRMRAELQLLNSKGNTVGAVPRNPWLGLKDAASTLHFKSARALKDRIKRGQFPPDCWRQIPTPSGKRHTYVIHVERYLKQLN